MHKTVRCFANPWLFGRNVVVLSLQLGPRRTNPLYGESDRSWTELLGIVCFSLFVSPIETSHLRDISVRYQCCIKCYIYIRHRSLTDTPLGLHSPSVTLSILPSEFKALLLRSPMTFESTNFKLTVRSHASFGHLGFPTGLDNSRGLHHSSMPICSTLRYRRFNSMYVIHY